MHWKFLFRAGLMAGGLLGAAAGSSAAVAAQAEAAADYDLPSQDLGDTLRSIARISRLEILFAADSVEGRRAPPVRRR